MIAVVTGAGSGIGRAAARALIDEGWTVVAAGRREAPLRETYARLGFPTRMLEPLTGVRARRFWDPDRRVFVETIRDIKPGEELGYDYQLTWESTDDPEDLALYGCRCGAKNCRGTMLDPEPLDKKKKKKK